MVEDDVMGESAPPSREAVDLSWVARLLTGRGLSGLVGSPGGNDADKPLVCLACCRQDSLGLTPNPTP